MGHSVTPRRSGIAAIAALLLLALAACGPSRLPAVALDGTPPAPASPIVVLVSLDGWRWDYIDRFGAPNLQALAARGIRAEALIPVFPSKTFPNHYTIVTGLYPEHHGITSNNMIDEHISERFSLAAAASRDPRWWSGEPLWITAIRQGRRANSMFWPGSDVEIDGVRPNEWRLFDAGVPNESRVEQVLQWLSAPPAERPSFITLYFEEVDTVGHQFGPTAPETGAAVRRLDAMMGRLIDGIRARGLEDVVTLIALSDHGMSQLSLDRRIFLDDYIDTLSVDMVDWSPISQIWPRSGSAESIYQALHGRHPALKVYRKQDMPAQWHFSENPRIAPVIAVADDGWAITTHARFEQLQRTGAVQYGDHGYAPENRSMHGLFIAAGPTLERGVVVPAFENVHLYEFMCRVLGLKAAKNDGRAEVTEKFFEGRASDHAASRAKGIKSRCIACPRAITMGGVEGLGEGHWITLHRVPRASNHAALPAKGIRSRCIACPGAITMGGVEGLGEGHWITLHRVPRASNQAALPAKGIRSRCIACPRAITMGGVEGLGKGIGSRCIACQEHWIMLHPCLYELTRRSRRDGGRLRSCGAHAGRLRRPPVMRDAGTTRASCIQALVFPASPITGDPGRSRGQHARAQVGALAT